MKKFSVFLCTTILVFCFATAASAVLVNTSFEEPETASWTDSRYSTTALASWAITGTGWVGTWDPASYLPVGASYRYDGDQVAYLNRDVAISQGTGYALAPYHSYTLSVMVGNRPDSNTFGDYSLELWAAETTLLTSFGVGSVGYDATTVDGWHPLQLTYNAGADIPATGEVVVVLRSFSAANGLGQVNFDAVSFVDPLNGPPVPEPATMLLLGTGLIGLASLGRKRFLKK